MSTQGGQDAQFAQIAELPSVLCEEHGEALNSLILLLAGGHGHAFWQGMTDSITTHERLWPPQTHSALLTLTLY